MGNLMWNNVFLEQVLCKITGSEDSVPCEDRRNTPFKTLSTILTSGSFQNHTTSSKKSLLHMMLPANISNLSYPMHQANPI